MVFDPSLGSDLAFVQFRTGQTGTSPDIAEDTIQATIDSSDNKWYAAAEVLEALIALWQAEGGGLLEEKVDDLMTERGDDTAIEALQKLITSLEEEGARQLTPTDRAFMLMTIGGPETP